MKKTMLFLLLLGGFQFAFGQDTLVTVDKKEIQVKILEISNRQVKYKLSNFTEGPVFDMRTNNIRKIEYSNGTVDNMGYENPRKMKPIGVSVGTAIKLDVEGGMFTTTLDYFILPQIDMELNIGSNVMDSYYYSVGSRFHLNSNHCKHAITPFVGLLVGSDNGISFVQIPVGLSYISKLGLQASVSLNQIQHSYTNWLSTSLEFRLGWRFNR